MTATRQGAPLTRADLLGYFLSGGNPRAEWKVGMEVEKLGRRATDGLPMPYDGGTACVRRVIELVMAQRGGDPVFEGDHLIGIDAPWGGLSLEPGGQVEWSSRPQATLGELHRELGAHLAVMELAAAELGVRWLDVAVDPEHPVSAMPWMPKARYTIMRTHLGRRGRLAHRMMTQTASVQCAYDYTDPEDWKRKFRAAALLSPVATALFANSSRIDGRDSGYRSYRQAIWLETDPDRCGLPPVVFEPGFDIERWLDWILAVPTIFLHRARGLVPTGGEPFGRLLERRGCEAVGPADWESHASTIFTEVRSYTYLELRSADLQPDGLCFAVPAFWTGILYDDDVLDEMLRMLAFCADHQGWRTAMLSAARFGLDAEVRGRKLRDLARAALEAATAALDRDTQWTRDGGDVARSALAALAARHGLGHF